jgi:hypothetical protein
MSTFSLVRHEDVTGISGEGVVARGWRSPSGKLIFEWLSDYPSLVQFDSEEGLLDKHGHNGKTVIEWSPQTVLGKIGELIAAGLTFTHLDQSGYGEERWVHVHTSGLNEWLAWLHALSAVEHPEDAAVQVDWSGPSYDWQHRWMDGSGSILVTYLSKGDS